MEKQTLPGSSTALTMGILSVVGALTCCGPFAIIFSIIGLSQVRKSKRILDENPEQYTGGDNLQTSRVLSYVGLGLSILMLILLILYFGVIVALIASGDIDHLDDF